MPISTLSTSRLGSLDGGVRCDGVKVFWQTMRFNLDAVWLLSNFCARYSLKLDV